jgi:hypothetical protein
MTSDEVKHWFQSRLVWLGNFITTLGLFLLWAKSEGELDKIIAMLPEGIAGYATTITGFLIIYLRYKTTARIGEK